MREEKVTLKCAGLKLAGIMHHAIGTPLCTAVISHGFAGSKDSDKWRFLCNRFVRAGISAFRFDHGGIGESEGRFEDTTLTRRASELVCAVATLRHLFPVNSVALVGSSFGGDTVIIASPHVRPAASVIMATPADFSFLNAIIQDSPADSDFHDIGGALVRKSISNDLNRYDIPNLAANVGRVLITHGTQDELVPTAHSGIIFEKATEPKRLMLFEGADHAFTNRHHQELLADASVDWITSMLSS